MTSTDLTCTDLMEVQSSECPKWVHQILTVVTGNWVEISIFICVALGAFLLGRLYEKLRNKEEKNKETKQQKIETFPRVRHVVGVELERLTPPRHHYNLRSTSRYRPQNYRV